MFDFASFYKKYNVDINKLKRDYEKNPLGKIFKEIYIRDTNKLNSRRYVIEKPYKEDIEYLYIELNIPLKDIVKYFKIKQRTFSDIAKFYKIKKSSCLQYENTKKYYIDNYGVNSAYCLESTKCKIKQTNLEKYGVEYVLQKDIFKQKVIQTTKDRYGVDNASKSNVIKDKKIKTTLQHYGVRNPFQSNICKEKIKQTNIERYGVDNPLKNKEIQIKGWKTKKLNGNIISSKPEKHVYDLLCLKFIEVFRQYRSEKYPFACDFYIPEKDLYIEYQGTADHGKEPYDSTNEEHLELLKFWKEKANEKELQNKKRSRYSSFIETWTSRDPLKRQTAKENNLNWLEFFNMNQFIEWYDTIETKKEKVNNE
jgi:hypothetical protein